MWVQSNWIYIWGGVFDYLGYSGGYYNPVLATGLKLGCKGHSHLEFFIVYWIGSSLGALASIYAYPPLKKALGIDKSKVE